MEQFLFYFERQGGNKFIIEPQNNLYNTVKSQMNE